MEGKRAKKRLRSGYTTGACAAAAAKAACLLLVSDGAVAEVTIPFPDGARHRFAISDCQRIGPRQAQASVIKDAGDDPDVTNGAEISALVSLTAGEEGQALRLCFLAGPGVGTVSKPGLSIAVGEPAINPVPRQMIRQAVAEALSNASGPLLLTVRLAVKDGEALAEKTLNHRLGVVGGLSILGSTGIVRPISAEAWTATIESSLSVARATGCREIVLSTGRTSEVAVQGSLGLPVEAYVMMGDYLHFSLTTAARYGFSRLHLAGMWAKILKAAMAIPQTHVRHGALEIETAAAFIGRLAGDEALAATLAQANTARQIYDQLVTSQRHEVITAVCRAARDYAQGLAGQPVTVHLVTSAHQVACHV